MARTATTISRGSEVEGFVEPEPRVKNSTGFAEKPSKKYSSNFFIRYSCSEAVVVEFMKKSFISSQQQRKLSDYFGKLLSWTSNSDFKLVFMYTASGLVTWLRSLATIKWCV
jgi:hypothetical protein